MRFKGRLEDFVSKKVLAEICCIHAPCPRKAMKLARCRVKCSEVYEEREDIREYIRVLENMDGVDMAGYEFDVLPEELRRFGLFITPWE